MRERVEVREKGVCERERVEVGRREKKSRDRERQEKVKRVRNDS